MTGYVAVERLERPRIRFAWSAGTDEPALTAAEKSTADVEDVGGEPLAARLREHLAELVVYWNQTTFYLFHMEGWR